MAMEVERRQQQKELYTGPQNSRKDKRFKFQNFSERVKSINVDVFHRVQEVELGPSDAHSYFQQELAHWAELNCTADFIQFIDEVSPLVQSLEMLLFNKDKVIQILLAHLARPGSLAKKALVNLISVLARDLRQHFVPYFKDLVEVLAALLNPKDTEMIEDIFTTIGYLFKFLQRQLLQDLSSVFQSYTSLLSHQKDYVRRFAAESAAFLLRKAELPGVKKQLLLLFAALEYHTARLQDGLVHLFFETVKGVKGRLHSRGHCIVGFLLSLLRPAAHANLDEEDVRIRMGLDMHACFEAVSKFFAMLCSNTTAEHSKEIWQTLFDELQFLISLQNQIAQFSEEDKTQYTDSMARIISILAQCISFRRGALIPDIARILKFVEKLCKPEVVAQEQGGNAGQSILYLFSAVLNLEGEKTVETVLDAKMLRRLSKRLFSFNIKPTILLPFFNSVANTSTFHDYFLSQIPSYCNNVVAEHRLTVTHFFVKLLRGRHTSDLRLDFGDIGSDTLRSGLNGQVPAQMLEMLSQCSHDSSRYASVWLVIQSIAILDFAKRPALQRRFFQTFYTMISDLINHTNNRDAIFLLSQALQLWATSFLPTSDGFTKEFCAFLPTLFKLLTTRGSDLHILRATDAYLQALSDCTAKHSESSASGGQELRQLIDEAFVYSSLEQLLPSLSQNISSPSRDIRKVTLSILSKFAPAPAPMSQSQELLQLCFHTEQVEAAVSEARKATLLIGKITRITAGQPLPPPFKPLVIRFLIARYHIKFKLFWQPAMEALAALAERDFDPWWDVFIKELTASVQGSGCDAPDSEEEVEGEAMHLGDEAEERKAQKMFAYAKHITTRSTDPVTFNGLLWETLCRVPTHVESRSETFVPFFLDFMKTSAAADDTDDEKIGRQLKFQASHQVAHVRIVDFLKLFSHFHNPRALHASEKLYRIFTRLLLNKDEEIQRLALECITRWKEPYIVPYKENLLRLIGEKTFREELVLFPLDPESSPIKPEHRAGLLPFLIRILYARLISRKGKSSKNAPAVRRATILSALASLDVEELGHFIDFVARPIEEALSAGGAGPIDAWLSSEEGRNRARDCVKRIPPSTQAGFLALTEDIFKQMATRMAQHIGRLVPLVLLFHYHAHSATRQTKRKAQSPAKEASEEATSAPSSSGSKKRRAATPKDWQDVRKRCMRCMIEAWQAVPNAEGGYERFMPLFLASTLPTIRLLPQQTKQPSSLLKCLLIMSGHPRLAPLLNAHPTIVPTLITCFGSAHIVPAVLMILLDIFNNVVGLSAEDSEVRDLLLVPHIPQLIANLLPTHVGTDHRSSLWRRKLGLLAELSEFVRDLKTSKLLLDALLPYLSQKKPELEVQEKILGIFKQRLCSLDEAESYLPSLCPLFATLSHRSTRTLLIDIFKSVARSASSIQGQLPQAVTLLEDLNSFSETELDIYDFERRACAYRIINEGDLVSLGRLSVVMILYNFFYFLSDADFSIRDPACYGLQRAIEVLSPSKCGDATMRAIVTHQLLPAIKKSLRSPQATIRSQSLTLLAQVVRHFPGTYPDLRCLDVQALPLNVGNSSESQAEDSAQMDNKSSADFTPRDSKSFFVNLCHVKYARNLRALRLIQEESVLSSLRKKSIRSILIPLLSAEFLFDTQGRRPTRNTRKKQQQLEELDTGETQQTTKNTNVTHEAIQAIAMLTARLPWPEYYAVLSKFSKMISNRPAIHAHLIKLLCNIIERFHYLAEPKETPSVGVSTDNEGRAMEPKNSEKKIEDALIRKVVPDLLKYLTDGKDATIILRPAVAMAIIKILKILPKHIPRFLPALITKLSQKLKTKAENVREETRQTLREVLSSLGVGYFGFMVEQLKSALTSGYQRHILGYTVHYLLRFLAMSKQTPLSSGELEMFLPQLLPVFIEELFGDVGREKEVQALAAKFKEIKKGKHSYLAFQLISRSISFSGLPSLMEPIRHVVEGNTSANDLKKIKDVLHQVMVGLNANKHVQQKDLLVYVHKLLVDTNNAAVPPPEPVSINEIKPNRPAEEDAKFLVAALPSPSAKARKSKKRAGSNIHVLAEFGLLMLHSAFKRHAIPATEPKYLQMLDPYVPLLCACLKSPHDQTILLTLKCLSHLLVLPLPEVPKHLPYISRKVLKLIQKDGLQTEIGQAGVKALTVIITKCKSFKIGDMQVKLLLKIVKTDLDELHNETRTFAILKAVISRRLIVPEIYDIMTRAGQMMVQNQSAHIRSICRQLTVKFILYYPLGEKRLRQHLNFAVNNLAYSMEAGRHSVLEMMNLLIAKLPEQMLSDNGEFFFLPLVLRLVNEESKDLRKMVGQLLLQLMRRANQETFLRFLARISTWYTPATANGEHDGDDGQQEQAKLLQRIAAQLFGICFEARPTAFDSNRVSVLLKQFSFSLREHQAFVNLHKVELVTDENEENTTNHAGSNAQKGKGWEIAYFTLRSFEKVLAIRSEHTLAKSTLELWELTMELMTHDHPWIRLAASRLLGTYFAACQSRGIEHVLAGKSFISADQYRVFVLARTLCFLLTDPSAAKPFLDQILRNLIFLGVMAYSYPARCPIPEKVEENESDEDNKDEEGAVVSATEKKTLHKRSLSTEEDFPALNWLFRRLSFIARRPGSQKRKIVMQWFAGMITKIDAAHLHSFLVPVVYPLFRIAEETGAGAQDIEVKTMGEEVTELLLAKVGRPAYFEAYNHVRAQITQIRQSRKRERALLAVLDPAASAKKKQKMYKKKVARHKRKILPYTIHRNSIKSKHARVEE